MKKNLFLLMMMVVLFAIVPSPTLFADTLQYSTDTAVTVADLPLPPGAVPPVDTLGGTTIGGVDIPKGNPFVTIDLPSLLLWENFIYHVFLFVLTWFSGLFPGLKSKRIPIRTIIIGGVLIAILVGMRFIMDTPLTWPAILSYLGNFLISTHAYDKIYKEIFGSSQKSIVDEVLVSSVSDLKNDAT